MITYLLILVQFIACVLSYMRMLSSDFKSGKPRSCNSMLLLLWQQSFRVSQQSGLNGWQLSLQRTTIAWQGGTSASSIGNKQLPPSLLTYECLSTRKFLRALPLAIVRTDVVT